jgi:hypothetical protein
VALIADHARGTLRVALSVLTTRVFVTGTLVREYSASTLQPLAETATYDISSFGMTWAVDAVRGQLLAGHVYAPRVFALGDDLVPRAAVDLGYLGLNPPVANAPVVPLPSTVRDRAFSFVSRYDYSSSSAPLIPGKAFLVAMDAGTLRPAITVDLIRTSGFMPGGGQAILLAPPPPPTALEQGVAGRHADLQWRDPGDATHFVVEVGTVPGRSNVGILHTVAPRFAVDDVPAGRYYVRVRALNDVGMSLPSNEVVLTVG